MSQAKMTPGPWKLREHATKYADLKEYSVEAPQGWQEPDGTYKTCGVVSGLDDLGDARAIACLPELIEAARATELALSVIAANPVRPMGRSTLLAIESRDNLRRILARLDGLEGEGSTRGGGTYEG